LIRIGDATVEIADFVVVHVLEVLAVKIYSQSLPKPKG
jgi:hypothetical protein